jgi:hypothetical protein
MNQPIKEEAKMKEQNMTEVKEEIKEQEKLLCPKAGTATSSPIETTTSQSFNVVNVMLWMQRNAYEESPNQEK